MASKFVFASILMGLMLIPASLSFEEKADTFTVYMLSLRWAPSVCSDVGRRLDCRKPYPKDLTIHGLWPQLPSGKPVPKYGDDKSCTKQEPIEPEQLLDRLNEKTKAKLRTYWPSLTDYQGKDANDDFWKSEWEKHGRCSDRGEEPDHYFTVAMKLQKSVDGILSTLQGAGIQPDSAKTYEAEDISDALRTRYGGAGRSFPEVACNVNENGIVQLKEIRFCFSRNGRQQPAKPANCHVQFSNKCSSGKDEVRFPPHPV